MFWVILFAAIALLGLAMVVSYGVWLAHKVADVASEVRVLGGQAEQLSALLSQIEVRQAGHGDRTELRPT